MKRSDHELCSKTSWSALSKLQLLGQSLGYAAVPTKTPSPLLFWTQGWSGPGLRPAPGENLVTTFQRNQTDIEHKMAVGRHRLEWCHQVLARAGSTVPPRTRLQKGP